MYIVVSERDARVHGSKPRPKEELTFAKETLLCFLTLGLPGLTSEDFRGLSRLSTITSTRGCSSSELDELDDEDDDRGSWLVSNDWTRSCTDLLGVMLRRRCQSWSTMEGVRPLFILTSKKHQHSGKRFIDSHNHFV